MRASSASCPLSRHLDPKTWDDVIAVNVTANWRLIRSLDPLLRRSAAGRVAFMTSGAASRAELRAYWGPYATSKAALDALARTYAAETVNTSNIRVMLINPGPLRTQMRAKAMPGEDPATLRAPQELAPKIVEICSPDWTETGKLYDFPSDRILELQISRLSDDGRQIDLADFEPPLYEGRDVCVPPGAERRAARSLLKRACGRTLKVRPPVFPPSNDPVRAFPGLEGLRAGRG